MSKLNVDQKTIFELFSGKNTDFLIPDYQRPYAWDKEKCEVLWDDVVNFAIPNNNCDNFDRSEEYFLGPIVTFKNENSKMEVIDGQQRLTTLMLLLRVFYKYFDNEAKDNASINTRKNIEKCIWKTNEFDEPNKQKLKIDSEVVVETEKNEFLEILKNGIVKDNMKSLYAINYKFFEEKIEKFVDNNPPDYLKYLLTRILNNCIILPIEAESQDTALRIFSTLNDRGLPLSDADIFKSKLYKYYSKKGEKDIFIEEWKKLENEVKENNSSMDDLFSKYMYFLRATKGDKSSTTEGLRTFYGKNNYEYLENDSIFENLKSLSDFWKDVNKLNEDKFSGDVLRDLFILKYAPNKMWENFVSVYFIKNKDSWIKNKWNNSLFLEILDKIIALTLCYAIANPGINQLRTPVYAEMVNIVERNKVNFEKYKFDPNSIENIYSVYEFSNLKPITKSMLVWWAFKGIKQKSLLREELHIEHIFAVKRAEKENKLKNKKNLESLGNKSILEKRINIAASDYRFIDKKRIYKEKETKIEELLELVKQDDFTEIDIEDRNKKIKETFLEYLHKNDMI